MCVGRDMMGTDSNTLILAFAAAVCLCYAWGQGIKM
ncbi:MAG: hypothetical protein V8R61_07595 [Enterocloster sp.]